MLGYYLIRSLDCIIGGKPWMYKSGLAQRTRRNQAWSRLGLTDRMYPRISTLFGEHYFQLRMIIAPRTLPTSFLSKRTFQLRIVLWYGDTQTQEPVVNVPSTLISSVYTVEQQKNLYNKAMQKTNYKVYQAEREGDARLYFLTATSSKLHLCKVGTKSQEFFQCFLGVGRSYKRYVKRSSKNLINE